jgi:hypothetical protein
MARPMAPQTTWRLREDMFRAPRVEAVARRVSAGAVDPGVARRIIAPCVQEPTSTLCFTGARPFILPIVLEPEAGSTASEMMCEEARLEDVADS